MAKSNSRIKHAQAFVAQIRVTSLADHPYGHPLV